MCYVLRINLCKRERKIPEYLTIKMRVLYNREICNGSSYHLQTYLMYITPSVPAPPPCQKYRHNPSQAFLFKSKLNRGGAQPAGRPRS